MTTVNYTGPNKPIRQHAGDAGYDCFVKLDEPISIAPGQTRLVSLGLAIALPKDENIVGLLVPRSGFAAKHGITLINCTGIIDPNFRGNIKAALINLGSAPVIINDANRVAQLVFVRFEEVTFNHVDELDETERNRAGFGSTGL